MLHIQNYVVFLSISIVVIIANSVDSDKKVYAMSHTSPIQVALQDPRSVGK